MSPLVSSCSEHLEIINFLGEAPYFSLPRVLTYLAPALITGHGLVTVITLASLVYSL